MITDNMTLYYNLNGIVDDIRFRFGRSYRKTILYYSILLLYTASAQDSVLKVLHCQLIFLITVVEIEQLMMHYLRYGILMNPVAKVIL